jgi:hypothetical protein
MMNVELHGRPRNPGRIVGGIAVVLVGLSMLADQIGYDDGLHLSTRYWPLILIAIGIVRLAETSGRDGRPLLIIGAGVLMVWRAVENPAGRGPVQEH